MCIAFYSQDTFNYYYCDNCQIIFRYNTLNIHHDLFNSGKLYYAEMICKYTHNNNSFYYCPKFSKFNEDNKDKIFIELYKSGIIDIEWKLILDIEECCVCFENTSHKTECNHIVCVSCITNLDKCPLCRAPFRFLSNKCLENNNIQEEMIVTPINELETITNITNIEDLFDFFADID
jgi:hypothetical protein